MVKIQCSFCKGIYYLPLHYSILLFIIKEIDWKRDLGSCRYSYFLYYEDIQKVKGSLRSFLLFLNRHNFEIAFFVLKDAEHNYVAVGSPPEVNPGTASPITCPNSFVFISSSTFYLSLSSLLKVRYYTTSL